METSMATARNHLLYFATNTQMSFHELTADLSSGAIYDDQGAEVEPISDARGQLIDSLKKAFKYRSGVKGEAVVSPLIATSLALQGYLQKGLLPEPIYSYPCIRFRDVSFQIASDRFICMDLVVPPRLRVGVEVRKLSI